MLQQRKAIGSISAETSASLAMVVNILFLGASTLLIKLSEMPPITTAFYRIFFALPLLYLWFQKASKGPSLSSKVIGRLLFSGVLFAFDIAIWHFSFAYTSVANATLFACLLPFIVIPVSYFFLHEKINRTFFIGVLVAITGIIFLLSGKVNPSAAQFFGDSLAFLAACFYAFYLLSISRLRGQCTAAQVMFWSSLGSALVLAPASFFFEGQFIPPSLYGLGIVVGLALLAQVGAQSLLAYAIGIIRPSLISIIVLLQPPTAALFAYFFFHETLSWIECSGMAITLVGVLIAKISQRYVKGS